MTRTTYDVRLGPRDFRTRSPAVAESFSRAGARVTAETRGEQACA